MEIGTSLARNARRHPHKPAIIFGEVRRTYEQLFDGSCRIANAVLDAGVPYGGNIGILARNSVEYVEACLGLGLAGMVASQLNYRLTAHDWAGIAQRGDLAMLFADRDLLDQAPALREIAPRVVLFGDEYDRLRDAARADVPDERHYRSTLMLNTSGTTGLPKGVLRSRHGFFERSLELGLTPDDVYLGALPVCLSAGIMYTMTTLVLGGTIVLMHEFDAAEAVRLVNAHSCTSTMLVPTMLSRFIEAQRAAGPPGGSLRRIIGGAGEVLPETKRACHEAFGAVLSVYAGSSEAGQYANLRPHEVLDRLDGGNCVGRPALGVEIELRDDSGSPVAQGEVGEIWVRSDAQFDGYYRDPEHTTEAMRDSFVSVGDLGRFDEDGYLWFIGRARDVIKSGGINVYASEVEAALLGHPDIAEVAVVGTPHPEWIEQVTAVVVRRNGSALDAAGVLGHADERLARFKRPRAVCFVDALPRNLTGRVLKDEVRAIARDRLTNNLNS